jgi:hypothetical protein
MAEVSRVRITGGSVSLEMDISYIWYTMGNDPWTRVTGSSTSFPSGGDWENRAIRGSAADARLYTPDEGLVAVLSAFRRVTSGSTGSGEFHGSGYTIPEYSPITWEVLSVS